MGAFLLSFELLAVFFLAAFLLNKYGNWRTQPAVVTLATFIGWFFSFTIIFVLPLDVSITFYNRCEDSNKNGTFVCEKPDGYVADSVLLRLWRLVYWTSQCLTWIVLPLLQSYCNVGEFTVTSRLKSALWNNVLYYGVYFGIFVLLLIYAVLKGVVINREHLTVILISASNTWGLFLLVVLLGYGLVELPRSLWNKGDIKYRLDKIYFDLDKLSSEKIEAEDCFKNLYRESRKILNSLKNEHGKRELAQIILSKFPTEVVDELFPGRSANEFSGMTDVKIVGSQKFLVAHHKNVIAAVLAQHRTTAQWKSLMQKALYIEDIAQARLTGKLSSPIDSILPDSVHYAWFVRMKWIVDKCFATVLSAMTVLILLSECTFFIVSPTLSPAALITEYTANHFHYKYVQFVAICIICYLCSCAYFTVFRLKIYKYYHLDAHKMTDENSLLFSAILLCRLTPPICLNFLGMIHLDSHITMAKNYNVETQFTKLMGHLDVIPILAKGINIYLPICILIFCAINYYKIAVYVLHNLGFDQYVADDNFTNDMVNAGRALVQLERNKLNRRMDRERREDAWKKGQSENVPPSTSRSSRVPEDRIPILTDDSDEFSLINYNSESTNANPSFREHPSPSNLFDDL